VRGFYFTIYEFFRERRPLASWVACTAWVPPAKVRKKKRRGVRGWAFGGGQGLGVFLRGEGGAKEDYIQKTKFDEPAVVRSGFFSNKKNITYLTPQKVGAHFPGVEAGVGSLQKGIFLAQNSTPVSPFGIVPPRAVGAPPVLRIKKSRSGPPAGIVFFVKNVRQFSKPIRAQSCLLSKRFV